MKCLRVDDASLEDMNEGVYRGIERKMNKRIWWIIKRENKHNPF